MGGRPCTSLQLSATGETLPQPQQWLQHHWQAATALLAADPASSIMKQCMVTTHHTVHHARDTLHLPLLGN